MITGYSDNFNRTVSNGFGTSSSGHVYITTGTASQYAVTGGAATITPSALGERWGVVDRLTSDIDISGQVALSAIPATNLQTVGFVVKQVDGSNHYNATMMVATGGAVSLRISKNFSGGVSTLTTVSTGITYVANTFYNLRVQAFWSDALQANVVRSKIWAIGATEPGGWGATITDSSFTQYSAGTRAGLFSRDEATTPGTIAAKIQNVVAKTYSLPIPATTDPICYVPNASSNLCSIGIADGTFETTTGGWTATGSTYARQTTVVHSGAYAGSMTAVGSPAQMYVRPSSPANSVPVTVGQSYTVTMWVRSATAFANVGCAIDWQDSGGAYLTSTSSSTAALTANNWTQLTITGTAPASAAFAIYGPTVVSPTAGQVLYFDEVDFQTTCATPSAPYPKQTALQALAAGADAAMVTLDPRVSLAQSFPRVRVSRGAGSYTSSFAFSTPTFTATEFNVGTATDLSYNASAVVISQGIWLATFEVELSPMSAREAFYVTLSGGVIGTAPNGYGRTETTNLNDDGLGGTARVAALCANSDPVLPVNIIPTLILGNSSTTYSIKYMALSAIKISDYF